MCSRKVVLHNAQIDKTVMIHTRACIQPLRTVLLWGIASHIEVDRSNAGSLVAGLRSPRGVILTMCSRKSEYYTMPK
jgi:hypothetical protein